MRIISASSVEDLEQQLRVVELEQRRPGRVRVAVYARVSDPAQKTVPEQVLLAREKIRERRWEIRYVLADEMSGEDFERTKFQRLFELADRHAIDVVIVWKVDRLARSFAQLVVLEEMLSRNKVAILSLTEPIDTTTSTGRFIFGIMASLARMENEIRRERVRMGMRNLARAGKWGRARVPFGYARRKDLRLRKVPQEAALVKLAFRFYRKRKSLVEVAADFNARNLTHRGAPWTADRVRKVLVRKICTGVLEASGISTDDSRLVIISKREFERTHAILSASRRSGKSVRARTRRAAINSVFRQYVDSLDLLPPSTSAVLGTRGVAPQGELA